MAEFCIDGRIVLLAGEKPNGCIQIRGDESIEFFRGSTGCILHLCACAHRYSSKQTAQIKIEVGPQEIGFPFVFCLCSLIECIDGIDMLQHIVSPIDTTVVLLPHIREHVLIGLHHLIYSLHSTVVGSPSAKTVI